MHEDKLEPAVSHQGESEAGDVLRALLRFEDLRNPLRGIGLEGRRRGHPAVMIRDLLPA